MANEFMRIAERAALRLRDEHRQDADDAFTGYSRVSWHHGKPSPGFFMPFDEYMRLSNGKARAKQTGEQVKALYGIRWE